LRVWSESICNPLAFRSSLEPWYRPPVRQPGMVASVGLCVAAALTACEGGAPVKRGFESRQLLSIRDPAISLGQWWGSVWAYNVAGEYWSLDLDTGETRDVGPAPPEVAFTPGTGPVARYDCSLNGDTSPYTLTITDRQSGKATVIDRTVKGWLCPTDSDPTIDAWREDAAGKLTLWTGPYDQIAVVPLDLNVSSVRFEISLAGTPRIGYLVYGARPSQPEGIGLFAIDPPDFNSREIIPAAVGTASWATGATPEGPLTSASLLERSPLTFTGQGRYAYERIMSDGGVTMFVGPSASEPSELALFRLSPSAQVVQLGVQVFDRSQAVHSIWWSLDVAAENTFIDWDERRQQLGTCPSRSFDRAFVAADPDGDWLAFSALDPQASSPTPGPLLLMGAGACTTVATADVTAFGFSPDGTATAWLVQPPLGDATLWAGGRGGSAPRVVGTGAVAGPPNAPRFVGPAELELQLGGDLAWIDVHDDPVRLHYVAERVFGTIDIGGWLVTGYELSGQDFTGSLGLVDRHTGIKRLISREVSSFTVVGDSPGSSAFVAPPPDVSAGPVRILYLVRGRNPSPQDGIWIATVTKNDLD
jgi:hypothetical protein